MRDLDCHAFPEVVLRNEAATKMDDGLPAILFSPEDYGRIYTTVRAAKQASTLLGRRYAGRQGRGCACNGSVVGGRRLWHRSPISCIRALVGAGRLMQKALGACVHLVISGEIPPQQRLQSVEYGLAVAVTSYWQRLRIPVRERANEGTRAGLGYDHRESGEAHRDVADSHFGAVTARTTPFAGQCRSSICSL
jgi:hypothetical protein